MGVPLVLFDRTAKELDVSKVVADDADAAFKIVQHLIHGGARRIALLTGPEQLSIGKNRMKGYLKAMTLNKLEINTDYIVRLLRKSSQRGHSTVIEYEKYAGCHFRN